MIDLATRHPVATWQIPGAAPTWEVFLQTGVLWLSGRYDAAVYAISTRDGHLMALMAVPGELHGLCVWPEPGRFSLGHTGVMR